MRRRKFEVVDSESKSGSSTNSVTDDENPFRQDVDGGIHAGLVEGPGTYYFGIIDILEEWSWKKKLERYMKIYLRFLDGDGISAMAPADYASRFWNRVVRDVFEYVEGTLDEDLDSIPKIAGSAFGRTFSGRSREESNGSDHFPLTPADLSPPVMSDEAVMQKPRVSDRRFSAVPMDFNMNRPSLGRPSGRATLTSMSQAMSPKNSSPVMSNMHIAQAESQHSSSPSSSV